MTDTKDDNFYRSSFAIPVEHKKPLLALIDRLQLDSLADLLTMISEDGVRHEVADALDGYAVEYVKRKKAAKDAARKIREANRLRAKLDALEGKP